MSPPLAVVVSSCVVLCLGESVLSQATPRTPLRVARYSGRVVDARGIPGPEGTSHRRRRRARGRRQDHGSATDELTFDAKLGSVNEIVLEVSAAAAPKEGKIRGGK